MKKLTPKYCKYCSIRFIPEFPNSEYCCDKCKNKAEKLRNRKKKKNNYNGQLCWTCKNATGSCPWSKNFTPIEDWTAEKVKRKDDEGYTYKITACPLYTEG